MSGSRDIDEWRAEIDALDHAMLRLLNERAQIAVNIGAIKRERGLVVLDLPRERAILERITAANESLADQVLDAAAVERIYRRIIIECRRIAAARNHLKLESDSKE